MIKYNYNNYNYIKAIFIYKIYLWLQLNASIKLIKTNENKFFFIIDKNYRPLIMEENNYCSQIMTIS